MSTFLLKVGFFLMNLLNLAAPFVLALRGVNVVPFLEMIGLPESIVGLLRESSSGYALTAYAMYKVISSSSGHYNNLHGKTLWGLSDDAARSSSDRHPCQIHRDSGWHLAISAVSTQARLLIHTATREGLHPGQNGGDEGEADGEDGGDKGEIFRENGGDKGAFLWKNGGDEGQAVRKTAGNQRQGL